MTTETKMPVTKKTKVIYWIITGLFSAFMIFSSVPDLLSKPEAIEFLAQLGYPAYIVPFLGFAKLLGVVAIWIPGFPRIREWAYAGLFFDLVGAIYSSLAIAGFMPQMLIMVLPVSFLFISYFLLHKIEAAKNKQKK